MAEELMNFDLPVERSSIIKVLGIGGGGNNAVNHMSNEGITDVNFIVCNTDAQALSESRIPVKVQIGEDLTEGRGAGSKPEIGRRAAEENIDQVLEALGGNTRMVFITTGMGGGTGTGAAPVIARACKEQGLLTIAVVTIPFKSEGKIRIRNAVEGINELKDHVDSLLVINNEKLREIFGDQPVSTAFAKADDVLTMAVKGIAEIITVAGYINVDFADVETVMHESGAAVMGTGEASGEERAIKAIEEAISSPLLNSNDIHGAQSILLNITTGTGDHELTMDELGEITDYVYDVASNDALIIRGLSKDESLGDRICVTIIATGFEPNSVLEPYKTSSKTEKINLETGQISTAEKNKKAEDNNTITVKTRKPEPFDDYENDRQKKIEFDIAISTEEKDEPTDSDSGTLRKIKHMQNILKKEGLSNKTMRENVDEFEDVPAFIRKKIKIDSHKKKDKSDVSKYTLSDENDEPTLRDDNAYLNDNVD